MRPKLTQSLKVAHAVLRHIDLPVEIARDAVVVGYENGREHGLCLKFWIDTGRRLHDVSVCWAESRGSDEIVVYVAEVGENFGGDGNVPTERAYRAARYFRAGSEAAAARYIVANVRRLNRKAAA